MNLISQNENFITKLKSKHDKINYFKIKTEFYQNLRNELTKTKLIELNRLAQKIEEPKVFGKFHNKDNYFQVLKLFLESTQETRHCGFFIHKKIIPSLFSKDHFLDIGPGDGRLTKWIGSQFKNVTIVDSDKKNLNRIDTIKIRKHGSQVEKIHHSILDFALPKLNYDLILLSHVLYYIDSDNWINITKKLYDAVKIGGGVLIVLSGDKGDKAQLIHHFSGKHINIDKFIIECQKKINADINVYISDEKFLAMNKIHAAHIAGFLLHDVNSFVAKKELINYLDLFYVKSKNIYEISSQQKFIYVHKKL